MNEQDGNEGLWLGDDHGSTRTRSRQRRQAWIAIACVACLCVLAIPVGFALSSSGRPPTAAATKTTGTQLGQGPARRAVLSALSATTGSGSFNVTYELDPTTAPTTPTTTTTTPPCHVVQNPSGLQGEPVPPPMQGSGTSTVEICAAQSSSPSLTAPITGQGTIDTDPFGMVATSNVPGLGVITIRDDGTDVWEIGGGDYGLSPGSNDQGPGSSLSGFAGLVEGTLGQRQGALAMGALASPTGYLDLEQSMIGAANEVGTGTVDGVAVTTYQVSIAPDASVPGLNAEQAKTIAASDGVLQAQGYTGSTIMVSIDASGFIRQTHSVAHFTDGATSSSEDTFSDFGCAGTVLMPGQTGATAPPAGCVSPDTGVAPTTTTTASVPASTSTSTSTSTTTSPAAPDVAPTTDTTMATTTTTTTIASTPPSSSGGTTATTG